jgi:hypothetical protein
MTLLACAAPAMAEAACRGAARTQLAGAARTAAQMQAAGAAGAVDATALVARGQGRCTASAFVAAVVARTHVSGLPMVGQRSRVGSIDLVGITTAQGPVWRLDLVRQVARATSRPTSVAARRARVGLRGANFGVGSIVWSRDPTLPMWDAGIQSFVAQALASSGLAADRRDAVRSVAAFAPVGRRRTLLTRPLLDHLVIAHRLAVAAGGQLRGRAAAGTVAVGAYARVRAAATPTWSRLEGRWSTGAQQRALVARASLLLARYPHAPTSRVVEQMRRGLVTAPAATLRTLPSGVFYPWPRDAMLDTQSMTAATNKPGTLELVIYAPDGRQVRSLSQPVEPGQSTFAWDGAAADGSTLGAGEYRYVVVATDLAGNRLELPGLRSFQIARDGTPPTIRTTTVRYLDNGALGARIVASWQVEEPLSPRVRTFLLLSNGAQHQSLLLDEASQGRGLRRQLKLSPGTWHTTFVFLDGSGNRASRPGADLMVR